MNEEAQKLLRKSGHALAVAQSLINEGFADDAAGKIYYAMFYAAQALLKSSGINVTKHSAVEAAFGFHFVKTGKISQHFHKLLISARKIREIVDYDFEREIVVPDAGLKISEGHAFLFEIKRYLSAQESEEQKQ